MSEFEGKVALITGDIIVHFDLVLHFDRIHNSGASSGIGKETAIHFASLGCRISITGRKAENLEYTKQECIVNGTKEENIFTLVGDVTNEEFAKQLIEETVNYFGRIDILVRTNIQYRVYLIISRKQVNCAGIGAVGTTENLSLQLYDEVMNVNCRSVFMLTQMAIPHLKKTRGNIINVSSVAGLRTFAGIVAYTMSKAALDQMTRTAALELAADGIRVNSVKYVYYLYTIICFSNIKFKFSLILEILMI
ncbi:putative oxidoreductase-like protein [Dinothrombium tinctorium]|uniref:Putative oxidoreductase-like protein n=1 Tax=Dinothrombium tinctorium TaxID=1965070 RepID=A0A3S4QI03_9ACAR|nr:putative oxidoreductase-like protein [Dinothrombium tinctorium]